MELEALDHVALTVVDVASSAEWYAKVLGLRRRVFEEEWGFESAKHELTERGVALDEWDHAVAWSVYFRSPDSHLIEITTYEPSPART